MYKLQLYGIELKRSGRSTSSATHLEPTGIKDRHKDETARIVFIDAGGTGSSLILLASFDRR